MKKINTSPISGMQELLPPAQATFDQLKSKISEVYHAHGYQHIETPVIDRTEVLLAKAGGDTEKQIYKVIKTAESAEDADQALRFDHTVPLARYVVEHENNLTFPFKVTQIARNFRGERAQKGRFREFYQCDIDVIGRRQLPLAYDADVISTLIETLRTLGLPKVLARISNRKILTGLLDALNLQNSSEQIFSIIDHAEKVPKETTQAAFEELNIGSENVVKITTLMEIKGNSREIKPQFAKLGIDNETFTEGVNELCATLELLESEGLGDYAAADLLIVRGLDYYTGTVFEFVLPDHREVGSIAGGGRYENLAGYFTDQLLPGVGGSIGLTRLFYVLSEHQLIPELALSSAPVDIVLMPLSENEYNYCFNLASRLRADGKSVDIDFSDKRLGDRFNRVSKIAKQAIVIGENEARTGNYQLKNLNA